MYKAINKILCGVDYSKHIRNTISSKNEMISLASNRYLSAFSKALNEDNGNPVRFYRGINVKLESPFMMGQYYREDEGDLSAFIRQNIFNVLPKWKNYPKRNKCIIAETEPTYPKAYGHLYLVLPENGTNIAIAPNHDIWNSFKLIRKTFGFVGFDEIVLAICELIKSSEEFYRIDKNDIKKVIDICNEIDNVSNVSDDMKKLASKILSAIKQYGTIRNLLDEVLDPEANGFKLISIENINASDFNIRGSEVWFDSESIFIPYDDNKDFRTNMKNIKYTE